MHSITRRLFSAALAVHLLLASAASAEISLPDTSLQQAAIDALSKADAREQGMRIAVVAVDMHGRVLVMADNAGGDMPMALTARATPGRTLTPLTGLAALAQGSVTPEERISDLGAFDRYDKTDPPRCWTDRPELHANLDFVDALRYGCDYYFFEIASRTGAEPWAMMAQALGLDRPSGLNLPGEAVGVLATPKNLYDPALPVAAQPTVYPAQVQASIAQHLRLQAKGGGLSPSDEAINACTEALMHMSLDYSQEHWVKAIRGILERDLAFPESIRYTQACIGPIYLWLNDIKWGGTQTVEAAVGNSFTQVTPVAMARYYAALANGGTVYDLSLAQDAANPPVVALDLTDVIGPYLPHVRDGLRGITDATGHAGKTFMDFTYRAQIGCMLVQSQSPETGMGGATWAVGFVPNENPEIAVVVLSLNAPDVTYVGSVFRDVAEACFR